MKISYRNLWTTVFSIFFANLNSQYAISLSVKGYENGIVKLAGFYGSKAYVLDSLKLDEFGKGIFQKQRTSLFPGCYSFIFPHNKYFYILINKQQQFSLFTDSSALIEHLQVSDNEVSTYVELQKYYLKTVQAKNKAQQAIENGIADSSQYFNATNNDLEKKYQSYCKNLLSVYPQTLLATYIHLMLLPQSCIDSITASNSLASDFKKKYQCYISNYFQGIDFTNEAIIHIPLFENRLITYFNQWIVQQPDSINHYIDKIMLQCETNKDVYRFVLRTIFQNYYDKYESKTYEACFIHLFDNYYLTGKAYWVNENYLQLLSQRVEQIRPTMYGKKVPEMTLQSPEDKKISLYQIKSPFVVLYFYEYDCGVCKTVTSQLINLQNQYKNKVTFMAISMLSDKEQWMNYIKINKLKWINVYDPLKENNLKEIYFIQKLPAIYLLRQRQEGAGEKNFFTGIKRYFRQFI